MTILKGAIMITQVSSLQHESWRDANFVAIGCSIRCPYRTMKRKVMMPTFSTLTVLQVLHSISSDSI